MEKIDIFDEEFYPLSPTSATIDEVHKKGLWHQTFACWLINPEQNVIFLQLRGNKNRIGPNTFDASAGGHLSAGEKSNDGFRELTEELGSNLNLYDKTYLGINKNVIIQGAYINREFCHVYFAKTKNDLFDFQLQQEEVAGLFKLNIEQGLALFSNQIKETEISGIICENGKYNLTTRRITQEDFCSYHDRIHISGYYLKIMIMAQKYVQNNSPYRI